MKKLGAIFIISLLFIIPLILNIISAQDEPPGLPSQLNQDPEITIEQAKNQTQSSTDYLKQEWTKILEKSSFGRFLLAISGIFDALNPLFLIFIGVDYSLSWVFFLSFAAWLALVIIIYKPLKEILQTKRWISISVSILVIAIAAQLGAIKNSVNFFLPLFTNTWILYIGIAIGALLVYFYTKIFDIIGEKMAEKLKKETEQRREQKARTVEKLHNITLKGAGAK